MSWSEEAKLIRYLVMWDITGLECIFNLTDVEKERSWAILKDDPVPDYPPLQLMILRARTNSQRHYEIYTFESEFTKTDIEELFKESPQLIVDAVRRVGFKIFSDRILEKTQVIV